ncbi:MAG: prepilin-type N-terminal cleavage/methylation domain-containing protein [Gammaproteobacteria bacterium]|nr:xcpT [Symbiodinium microadriaticum]
MKTLNTRRIGKTGEAGFTIIELVVVILLLGILTATALPRFMDISDEAHGAVVDAALGSMASGLAMYRATWFAEQQPATAVGYGASDLLADTGTGYPFGTAGADLDSEADCVSIAQSILQQSGNNITFAASGGASNPTAAGAANVGGVQTADFIAILVDPDGTPGTGNDESCEYYYTAQTATVGDTIPYLTYRTDGTMTRTNGATIAAVL